MKLRLLHEDLDRDQNHLLSFIKMMLSRQKDSAEVKEIIDYIHSLIDSNFGKKLENTNKFKEFLKSGKSGDISKVTANGRRIKVEILESILLEYKIADALEALGFSLSDIRSIFVKYDIKDENYDEKHFQNWQKARGEADSGSLTQIRPDEVQANSGINPHYGGPNKIGRAHV